MTLTREQISTRPTLSKLWVVYISNESKKSVLNHSIWLTLQIPQPTTKTTINNQEKLRKGGRGRQGVRGLDRNRTVRMDTGVLSLQGPLRLECSTLPEDRTQVPGSTYSERRVGVGRPGIFVQFKSPPRVRRCNFCVRPGVWVFQTFVYRSPEILRCSTLVPSGPPLAQCTRYLPLSNPKWFPRVVSSGFRTGSVWYSTKGERTILPKGCRSGSLHPRTERSDRPSVYHVYPTTVVGGVWGRSLRGLLPRSSYGRACRGGQRKSVRPT